MRYGRVPKRSRERGGSSGGMDDNIRSPSGGFADPSTPDSSDSCSTGTGSTPPQQMTATPVRDPESRQLAIYDTILTVSQAFHAHCAYTEEKIRGIVRSPINIIVSLTRNGPLLAVHFTTNRWLLECSIEHLLGPTWFDQTVSRKFVELNGSLFSPRQHRIQSLSVGN